MITAANLTHACRGGIIRLPELDGAPEGVLLWAMCGPNSAAIALRTDTGETVVNTVPSTRVTVDARTAALVAETTINADLRQQWVNEALGSGAIEHIGRLLWGDK